MKFFLLIFLLVPFRSESAACLPDSLQLKSLNNASLKSVEEIAQKFELGILPSLPREFDLVIQMEPLNPRVNAEINIKDKMIVISVLGGMASHPRMNTATMYLLLCHEIGHFLGGPPLKSRTGWSSTEGQSDYFSTNKCFKKFGFRESDFFDAALRVTRIYAQVTREEPPELGQCDQDVVSRINYGYPKVQCRLDTLVAGWNEEKRPFCWFKN